MFILNKNQNATGSEGTAIIGGAIVAILALPKLGKKSLHERRMNKETHKL